MENLKPEKVRLGFSSNLLPLPLLRARNFFVVSLLSMNSKTRFKYLNKNKTKMILLLHLGNSTMNSLLLVPHLVISRLLPTAKILSFVQTILKTTPFFIEIIIIIIIIIIKMKKTAISSPKREDPPITSKMLGSFLKKKHKKKNWMLTVT